MVKVIVLSHYLFDERMKEMGLDDNNVEDTNMAFISIIGTKECIEYWIQEDDKHYFKDHPNVLNLDFDDISDVVIYNGHRFRGMNLEEAEKTVNFIEEYLNNGSVDTIYIHCKAGMSRSRAIGEFIYRYCKENDIELEYSDREYYTTIFNQGVMNRLNHAYWKKHRLMRYEEDNLEYPDYLVNPNVRIINRDE
jgi:hypothetical protein